MKKRLVVLLATFIIILSFCACGNNDNGNIGKDGTLTDDVKGIMDDGDLDMNDNTNNGTMNDSTTNNNVTGTVNDTTGNMTDDATK